MYLDYVLKWEINKMSNKYLLDVPQEDTIPPPVAHVVTCFSVRRTMFKTLREKVQEAELAHVDPTTIVLRSTKKKWADMALSVLAW